MAVIEEYSDPDFVRSKCLVNYEILLFSRIRIQCLEHFHLPYIYERAKTKTGCTGCVCIYTGWKQHRRSSLQFGIQHDKYDCLEITEFLRFCLQ